MDAEELTAGLGIFREILGADVEGACRECLLDRNIDTADPCLIHAHMGDEVAAAIRDRDIHGLSQFLRLPLRRGNDPACIFQCDHNNLLQVRRRRAPRFVVQQLRCQHILWCHYRAISEARASITVVTFDDGRDGALHRERGAPYLAGARMTHRQLIFCGHAVIERPERQGLLLARAAPAPSIRRPARESATPTPASGGTSSWTSAVCAASACTCATATLR